MQCLTPPPPPTCRASAATSTAAVFLPGDEGWDDARRAWNLSADLHPAAVVEAADAGDVARVVDLARERGLRVTAQSTGHGAGCHGPLGDTILLRTGRLDGIEIDAAGGAHGSRRACSPPTWR